MNAHSSKSIVSNESGSFLISILPSCAKMRRMNVVLMVQTKLPIQVFLNIVVKFMISVSKDDLIHADMLLFLYIFFSIFYLILIVFYLLSFLNSAHVIAVAIATFSDSAVVASGG